MCYFTIMMIGGPDRKVRLWKSTNLLDWKHAFDIPGKAAECIDMYEVAVDGDPSNKKWVIADAGTRYEVGEFNGTNWKGFGDTDKVAGRINANYKRRAKVCDLNEKHVALVETARTVAGCAKYTGSGGAIVGICDSAATFRKLQKALRPLNAKVIRPKLMAGRVR